MSRSGAISMSEEAQGAAVMVGAGHVDLSRLGVRIRVPSTDDLRNLAHSGQWFSGAGLGHEFGFRCGVDIGTALVRLICHFGVPNSPQYACWHRRFLEQREKTTWEFILVVNGDHLFAVYDYKGEVAVGYRLLAPRGAFQGSRRDFRADAETCERVCRYIEAVVNFPSERVQAPRR